MAVRETELGEFLGEVGIVSLPQANAFSAMAAGRRCALHILRPEGLVNGGDGRSVGNVIVVAT